MYSLTYILSISQGGECGKVSGTIVVDSKLLPFSRQYIGTT